MSKRTVLIDDLRDWQDDNREHELGDDLHVYFEEFGRWDWCEIYREGLRVWEVMFDSKPDELSPIASLFAAVAAQSSAGAYAAVAAALGIDMKQLQYAIADWEESQDDLPAPVGISGLESLLEKVREDYGIPD